MTKEAVHKIEKLLENEEATGAIEDFWKNFKGLGRTVGDMIDGAGKPVVGPNEIDPAYLPPAGEMPQTRIPLDNNVSK
jgi:hypothetical protein